MLPALKAALDGRRIDDAGALALFREADFLDLGRAAREVSRRIHGDGPVTFLIDRNVNYTNICVNRCRFCAFFRDREDPEAYLLSTEEIQRRVAEAVERGATQVMLQGGLHPDIRIEYFENVFKVLKSTFPVVIHSLSPPEIIHLAEREGISLSDVIDRLRRAGLDSLPGAGAEILVDRVRRRISPKKIGARRWLEVMETAHGAGMPGTATMMFGAGESVEDRVAHLASLRALQDRTGGFISFIPWTFQSGGSDLDSRRISPPEYLRTLAISRIFLDNFRNVQGSWVTQGPEIGQLSLFFGANDLGSIMLEENVVRAAGVSHRLTREGMISLIHGAGRDAAQRDTLFHNLHFHPLGDRTFEKELDQCRG